LRGEYGVKGVYVGVPVVIGARGVEKVVEIKLNKDERVMFLGSVRAVRELLRSIARLEKRAANSVSSG